MDRIEIKNLEIFANHGVSPEENKLGQKFFVSAVLYLDTRRAGRQDKLSLSVNYGEVCGFIHDFMRSHMYRLIEAAAEQLAAGLLNTFERLEKVEIELAKPWAPIGLPLDTVSIRIERGWHKAYLSLGSNLGDREGYLNKALEALAALPDTKLLQASSFLETKPYGNTDQGDFLNGAAAVKTQLQPQELLLEIQRIEKENGRKRLEHWGPRTLDLDIVFYDSLVMETPDLVIPHPDMENRGFVLRPLMELCPYFRHPLLGRTVEQLYGAWETMSGREQETP